MLLYDTQILSEVQLILGLIDRVQDDASLGKAGARKTFQHTTACSQTFTGHEHHQMHKQGNQQHKDWITKTTEKTDLKLYQVGTTYMTCKSYLQLLSISYKRQSHFCIPFANLKM